MRGSARVAAAWFWTGVGDTAALRQALDDGNSQIVAGSLPTTGRLSGSIGILGLERGAQTRRPDLFQERGATRTRRLDALEGMQPGSAPDAVTTSLRQRLADIERAEEEAVTEA